MKHGIYYAYWEQEWAADYKRYIEKVAKLGFDLLEIGAAPLPDYSQQDVMDLKKCADDNGIMLTAGYGPTVNHNIGSSDAKIREEALEWYKKLFAVMAALDIRLIGGALYSYWPVDFASADKAEDWKRSVEGMQNLAPIAGQYGINMGMEVLNRFESHILNTSEEGVKFVEEVGMDNVKVMLDTFHMNIEESSIGDAIRRAGKLLGHFHTGECNRMVPGKGRTPWREIGDALRDIGYDGTVVMEPFVRMGGQVGSDIKVWRDISRGADEERLDEDARRAVEFQRYMLEWNSCNLD
ncbi:D-psicose 3-epimerase [Dorea sp. D27]|uniref:D-psicose 3-epimerase n=1 Tax=Dorea sp. D27 TaxID=658665 RepID=UPI0006733114|nr:sugar phosphate isomerase/epimerase family protein [Dorea sp. D27]KMZ53926.1 D-tagatose 3-epimerase [Dorea sp. D27]